LKILQNIKFLARQNIALRGDSDESESNFVHVLKLRGEDDSRLQQWLQQKANKYTSLEIQNEMLQIMALKVLREMASSISKSDFFSIMAEQERTFSAMRRVKSYLRATMTQERLNHLMVLHIHKSKTDSLDLIDLAITFVNSEHRLQLFGQFCESDLGLA